MKKRISLKEMKIKSKEFLIKNKVKNYIQNKATIKELNNFFNLFKEI